MMNQNPIPIPVKGAVTIQQETDFLGAFKSRDAEPTKFGPEVWEILQKHWKNLHGFAAELLKYGYWEEYISDGFCDLCGKFGQGHCHVAAPAMLMKLGVGELAPDPKSRHHGHIPYRPTVKSENAENDGLWINWIYNIYPDTYELEVLKSVRAKGTHTVRRDGRKWKQESYQYFSVAIFSLHGDEPAWEDVEHKGKKISEYYHKKYNSHQSGKKLFL